VNFLSDVFLLGQCSARAMIADSKDIVRRQVLCG